MSVSDQKRGPREKGSSKTSSEPRFGAIGVFGLPNCGKSSLVNALVGEAVSIVSPRPQTTRRRVMGILTVGTDQMAFCDTPGLHRPRNKLDEFMAAEVDSTLEGLHAGLYLVDLGSPRPDEDSSFLKAISGRLDGPLFLVFNKRDLVKDAQLGQIAQSYEGLASFAGEFQVSALKGTGLKELLRRLREVIPPGPHGFSEDDYTSLTEREIAEEVIREEMLKLYRHEIPHSTAVVIEEFKERENGKTYIEANLFLEKESQKRIVIGRDGTALKTIGTNARERLNHILGRDIFLQLWVKVRAGWRKSAEWVRRLGYKPT